MNKSNHMLFESFPLALVFLLNLEGVDSWALPMQMNLKSRMLIINVYKSVYTLLIIFSLHIHDLIDSYSVINIRLG